MNITQAYTLGFCCGLGFSYHKLHKLSFDASTNNPYWITTKKGKHFLIDEDGVIQSGRFKNQPINLLSANNVKNNGQTKAFSRWNILEKKKERTRLVLTAYKQIQKGAKKVQISNLRNDLKEYGGSNNITIDKGIALPKHKGYGLEHIADKHGNKAVYEVLNAVANGQIVRYIKSNQTVAIQHNGYEAILSLREGKRQKTWLLTGYDIIP